MYLFASVDANKSDSLLWCGRALAFALALAIEVADAKEICFLGTSFKNGARPRSLFLKEAGTENVS